MPKQDSRPLPWRCKLFGHRASGPISPDGKTILCGRKGCNTIFDVATLRAYERELADRGYPDHKLIK